MTFYFLVLVVAVCTILSIVTAGGGTILAIVTAEWRGVSWSAAVQTYSG